VSTRQAGVRWLQMLGKHAELIIDAYHTPHGFVPKNEEEESAIDELIKQRVAWRPEDAEAIRLIGPLRTALDQALKTVRLHTLDARIGESVNEIFKLGITYNDTRKRNENDASLLLAELEEMVFSLCENLTESSRQIWRHIDTKFSSVTSLDAKLKLNQMSLDRAERIVKSIGEIDLAALQEISGSNADLRRLFNIQLPRALEFSLRDMTDAFARLDKILFDLRELKARSRLVQRFVTHYQRNPGYVPNDYAEWANVPSLFCAVEALIPGGCANVRSSRHELILQDLLVGIRTVAVPDEDLVVIPVPVDVELPPRDMFIPSPFKAAIRDLFANVLQERTVVSGLSGYSAVAEDHSPAIWIYGILAEYASLSHEHRKFFKLEYVGHYDPVFDGNFIAKDVRVCPA